MRTVVLRGDRRRGGSLIELALVCPIVLILIIGMLVGGLGVFRQQQLAQLARDGARWAAVRGPKFQEEQEQSPPTSAHVLQAVILPRMVGLDPDQLTCTLTMTPGTATVNLTYQWVPEALFPPVTLTSTSVATVTY